MIKIIADSAADFTPEEISKENLEVLNLIVIGKDEEYKDGLDIDSKELFDRMENGEVFKTSQVPVADFIDRFSFYASRKIDFIYYSLSKEISGTYESAQIALAEVKNKYPDVKMSVIDSKSATAGCALGVRYLKKAEEMGYSYEDICELANFLSGNTSHIFTVEDLKYLHRGGRLSKGQMIIGNLLNIMPIITLEEGKLNVVEKARGKNTALKKIIDFALKTTGDRDLSKDKFYLIYGKEEDLTKDLMSKLENRLEVKPEFEIRRLGSVIGAHTGPEITGIVNLKESLPEKFKDIYI